MSCNDIPPLIIDRCVPKQLNKLTVQADIMSVRLYLNDEKFNELFDLMKKYKEEQRI